MKSAYITALSAAIIAIWLYKENKKVNNGMNLQTVSVAGWLCTRILIFVISAQPAEGVLITAAMDIITAFLCYILFDREQPAEYKAEHCFLYVFNPAVIMSFLSQNRTRMFIIWAAVVCAFLIRRLTESEGRTGFNGFRYYVLFSAAFAGRIYAEDILGQSLAQCTADGDVYPILLISSMLLFVFALIRIIADILSANKIAENDSKTGKKITEYSEKKSIANRISQNGFIENALGSEHDTVSRKLSYRDIIAVTALTFIYAVIVFFGIGSRYAPQSIYRFDKSVPQGNEMVLRFDKSVSISDVKIYLGAKEKRHFAFSVPDADGTGWDVILDGEELKSVFCWNSVHINYITYELGIVSEDDYADIREIVILNKNGTPILPVNADSYPAAFDEQELYPEFQTYYYETMFDEVYHARTAYELLHGLPIYEITHPPLGKELMSIGVKMFGMTPFGWRFVCAVFGIMLVPVMYAFVRMISGDIRYAIFGTVLFMTDFMHFTLSRIGTIDSIVGFFILLSFCLMYAVIHELDHGLSTKTVLLMMLNGIAAGAAIAVKWTGVYAGAGIAVIFAGFLYKRQGVLHELPWKTGASRVGTLSLSKLFAVCVLSYIAIPAAIYIMSYIPYVSGGRGGDLLSTIAENTKLILSYHSSVVQSHPYSSEWYEWLWMKRPLLDAYTGLADGKISIVSTFGNPLIWWGGIPALLFNMYLWIVKKNDTSGYLCIAYLSMLIPWLFIHRTVYIYQYYVCSMLLVPMIVNSFRFFGNHKIPMIAAAVIAIGLFVFYYPVISGYPVNREFAKNCYEWLSSWSFA